MADCPKCGEHLRLTDWKQHCPHCGVNLILYDRQERLMREADIAEVQHYHFQKKIDRLKTAFIGSKAAVVRIFTSLLPIGALFLPLWKLTAPESFDQLAGNVTAINVYNAIRECDLGTMWKLSPLLTAGIASLALSAVLVLLHFILLTLACSPKAKVRGVVLNVLLLLTALLSVAVPFLLPKNGAFTGGTGVGAYLYLALMTVNAAVDFWVLRHPAEIVHKQCYVGGIPIEEYFEMEKTMTREAIRAEQYRRLQAQYDEKQAAAEAAEREREANAHG